MKTTADLVDSIIGALRDRPEDFTCDKYILTDKVSGMAFWVANGSFNAGIYKPYSQDFGALQSWRFHAALKQWKIWDTTRRLHYAPNKKPPTAQRDRGQGDREECR